MLISYDEARVIMSSVDDAPEHHILPKLAGFSELDIDQYFPIVLDKSGLFCPLFFMRINPSISPHKRFYASPIKDTRHALKSLAHRLAELLRALDVQRLDPILYSPL